MAKKQAKNINDKPYTNRELRDKWHTLANTLQNIETQLADSQAAFHKHQEEDSEHFGSIDKQLTEIKLLIEPLSDMINVFKTISRIGRWGKIALGTTLLLLSIGIAMRTLLKL